MIPILYEGTETEFTSQGLGSLSDATSCTISEEINNTYELEMNYPMTGVHFFDIKVGRIILATPAPRKESEPFSIYKISKPIDGIVTIYAEHISYRLSYIPVKPFSASNCYEALNGCVENSLEDNPFTVWTDKALNINFSFNKPQSFRLCLGGVEGSILDTYRGEYEFNRFTVKLHTNRGSLKDTAKIIYGKNLTDLKQEESIENTVTGIVPYWHSTVTQTNDEGTSTSESVEVVVTLPEYVLESEHADKFPYRRTVVVDLSEYFQEQPTVDELRTRANQYMKDNLTGLPAVSLTVSFIDLARSEENKDFAGELVYLGDQVPVYFEKLGIAAKAEITSAIYDVLADRYDSLTLGTVSSSLSKTLNEISKKQDTVVTQTNLQSALILAQKVMSGGAGGYIVTKYFNGHPSETYYGDTDNVDTMVNVIRINKNGIAFSNSGISGPYVSAWTIDGKFNADFIQAGKISGSFIEANSITVGKLSDEVKADISNAKEGAEKANNSIIDLQKQIDGVIESWSADPVPTLTNYPASSWTTNEDKEKHIGDLYYDKNNKCYRFMQNSDGSFAWKLIADTDVTKAIADAQKALDATDQSVTGVTTEYYASTSATELKGGSWSEDRPAWTESNYIWSRTKTTTKAGITTYSSPSCIQGNSGTDGKDGISPTVAISKSDGSTTITITDKNGTHSQTVKDGINGTPGATGADGKASYFHVKYSNDGGKTFTPNNGEEVGAYIGTYSDFEIKDSTSVSAYTWAKIKGEPGVKGEKGADGTSVKITGKSVTYQASTSGTTTPTGAWVANPPTVAKGQYLWTKTVVTYSDGNSTTAYSVAYQGTNGANGQNGTNGRGVKSTEVTYQIWTDGTTTPSGAWSTSVPDTTADKPYLWTRTIITYTDNTKSTSYSVGSTLKGVNVGGRNLFTHTKTSPGTTFEKGEEVNGFSTIWKTFVKNTFDYIDSYSHQSDLLIPRVGQTYTIQMMVRGRLYKKYAYKDYDLSSTNLFNIKTVEYDNSDGIYASTGTPFNWMNYSSTNPDSWNELKNGTTHTVGSIERIVVRYKNELYDAYFYVISANGKSCNCYYVLIGEQNTGGIQQFWFPNVYGNGAPDSRTEIKVSENWKLHSHQWTPSSELDSETQHSMILCRLQTDIGVGTVEIYAPKFELGNIATDWTPAPEDVDADISNAQTSADKANTNASNAQSSANNALDTANKADAKADQAKSDAASANTAAQIAKKQADNAQAKSDEANRIANGAQIGVSNIEQVVKIDTQGVRIYEKANSKNYVHQKSDGSHFYTNNIENGVLGPDSRMNNLAVQDYLMFGAHRAELKIEDGEEGTALFHVGDIK